MKVNNKNIIISNWRPDKTEKKFSQIEINLSKSYVTILLNIQFQLLTMSITVSYENERHKNDQGKEKATFFNK